MSVLAESNGRGDVLLTRGVTNRLACRWLQKKDLNGDFLPVDLTNYTCTFELHEIEGDNTIYSQPCDAHGSDGVAAVYIPPAVFTGTKWTSMTSGTWKMTATINDTVELLGWGYWNMIN